MTLRDDFFQAIRNGVSNSNSLLCQAIWSADEKQRKIFVDKISLFVRFVEEWEKNGYIADGETLEEIENNFTYTNDVRYFLEF